MTMEFEVPKDIFTGLHYPSTWFNGFCDGRGKRVAMVEKNTGPWKKICYDNSLMIFFLKREDEDKKMFKL
jgi:hypothetical protein